MTNLNLAVAIFLGMAILLFGYGVDIIQRHGFDQSWPGHARYHAALSGLHLMTFAVIIAVAATGGLRKKRRSAWIMLAIASTLGTAAWPLARLLAGDPPPMQVQLVLAAALAAGVIALVLSFQQCFREGESW